MVESDTIKLLRECDAGVKMGVKSIEDVIPSVKSESLRTTLCDSKCDHEELGREIRAHLDELGDDGKKPNPIATGMSAIKTNLKLAMKESDKTVASLMTDGCNMGTKSLSRYLNQYEAADEFSKDIAKKLIHLEESLAENIRGYL